MISSLHGKLIYKDPTYAVIECAGIGFKCSISANTLSKLPEINGDVFLYTIMNVREDAVELYGFSDNDELECFRLVTSVSGVGAKIGIALLSAFTSDKLALYIAGNDAKALTAASGVGIKLAQRIVLELKDKISSFGVSAEVADTVAAVGNASVQSNTREAIAALVTLGFSQSEASLAVGRLDSTFSTESLIKEALKQLSRQV